MYLLIIGHVTGQQNVLNRIHMSAVPLYLNRNEKMKALNILKMPTMTMFFYLGGL